MTLNNIREKISADSYHKKGTVVTLRWGFFYKHGRTTQDRISEVERIFPTANIIESGEHWAAFRGGASVSKQSHWYVKFEL